MNPFIVIILKKNIKFQIGHITGEVYNVSLRATFFKNPYLKKVMAKKEPSFSETTVEQVLAI